MSNRKDTDITFHNVLHDNNVTALSSLYSNLYSENVVDNFIYNSNINNPKVIK
ncbi:hypothetical protein [Clostridium sp. BJN0001]|uniref:hypothetical protein n=1 Tax=Clostridium sp. BJN0001 TaxID=2930219 RepID=UPI001FD49705|nr:hypothetical protein [Clostridium sp. BJN0001]